MDKATIELFNTQLMIAKNLVELPNGTCWDLAHYISDNGISKILMIKLNDNGESTSAVENYKFPELISKFQTNFPSIVMNYNEIQNQHTNGRNPFQHRLITTMLGIRQEQAKSYISLFEELMIKLNLIQDIPNFTLKLGDFPAESKISENLEENVQKSYDLIINLIDQILANQHNDSFVMFNKMIKKIEIKLNDLFDFETNISSDYCQIRIMRKYEIIVYDSISGNHFDFHKDGNSINLLDSKELDEFYNDLVKYAFETYSISLSKSQKQMSVYNKMIEQTRYQAIFNLFIQFIERKFNESYNFDPIVGRNNLSDNVDAFKKIFLINYNGNDPTQININGRVYTFHINNQITATTHQVILSVGNGTKYHQIESIVERIDFYKMIIQNAQQQGYFISLNIELVSKI